jgi:CubicO group peptidase (beta-lactamase class C family)
MKKSMTSQVDELFSQWDKPDSPGCALAIVQNGEMIYQRGYGMADLEHNIPISPNSVFEVGSNAKQFTAACIMMLAKQNLLSLDDELKKYISEIPEYSHPITLRHLIHHTSGLRDYLDLMDFSGMILENNYSNEEIIALLARQKSLNFTPGTEQVYCNSGYFLLAQIVKRVSGKSLRDFAEEKIFGPLGMKNTHFHDDFKEIVKNRSSGYAPKDGGNFEIAMSLLDCCGDGQLYTTIEDLYLWDRNFYHNILGDYGQDLIEELTTPGKLSNGQILTPAYGFGLQAYGFGLQIGKYKGLKVIYHGGSWQGYRSDLVRFPDCQFSVICLANLSTFEPSELALQITDLYLEDKFTEETSALVRRSSVQAIELSVAELEIRTGFYYNPKSNGVWELEVKDGKLMVKLWGLCFQLVPIDSNHFQSIGHPYYDYDVEFPIDSDRMKIEVDNLDGNGLKVEFLQKMLSTAPDRLIDYLGTYYSAELESSYNMILEEDKLFFKPKGYSPVHLKSIEEDLFLAENDRFEFIRDENDLIIGFDRCGNRVRRLHFSKQ